MVVLADDEMESSDAALLVQEKHDYKSHLSWWV